MVTLIFVRGLWRYQWVTYSLYHNWESVSIIGFYVHHKWAKWLYKETLKGRVWAWVLCNWSHAYTTGGQLHTNWVVFSFFFLVLCCLMTSKDKTELTGHVKIHKIWQHSNYFDERPFSMSFVKIYELNCKLTWWQNGEATTILESLNTNP